MRGSSLLAPLACAALAGLVGRAEAHTFEFPKTLRLGIESDRILVFVTYDVNPGEESLRVRALFDRDGDGVLDDLEQGKIARFLEETATQWLEVAIDGSPVRLDRIEVSPHDLALPRGATHALGIALLFAAPLPPAAKVALRIGDRDKDAARSIPLVVDLAVGWDVALASQGELFPRSRRILGVNLATGRSLELHLRRSPRSTE